MAVDGKIKNITNLVLEGHTLSDAVSLVEAVLDSTDVDNFVKSPFYKGIEKQAMNMLKKVEDADGYRDKRDENPEQSVKDEMEDLEYMAGMFSGLRLNNFPTEIQSSISKLIRSANNGLKRGEQKLRGLKTPEEISKAFTPLEYTKRALTLATDVFNILNIPWDYDYTWQNYLYVADPGNTKAPAKKDTLGRREVDYKVPEERLRELAHSIMEALIDGVSFKDFCEDKQLREHASIESLYTRLA